MSRGRAARRAGTGFGVFVVLLAIVIGILMGSAKPRIAAAIRAATGRQVVLNGPIGFSLTPPSIKLRDVVLANPPGFATPNMATARAVTLRVDLGALLRRRIVIRQLVLDAPVVTLERNAAGEPNWDFAPPASPVARASFAAPRSERKAGRFTVLAARVEGGTLAYRDDRGGQAFVLDIPHLGLKAAGASTAVEARAGDMRLSANASVEDKAIRLRDVRLASPAGNLAGTVDVTFAPRPTVRAELSGTRLDLAALRVPTRTPAPSPAPGPPTPLAPAAPGHLVPDTKLPLDALRSFDGDVRLKLGALAAGRESLRDVLAHAVVNGGALSLTAHATFGAAPVDLSVLVDASPAVPSVAAALNAPAVPVAVLLAALGQPAAASGTMAIGLNLHGTGETPHAIAAGLDGFAAASMSGGSIQTKVLEKALGPAIARVNPLGLLGGAESEIRCLAVRATTSHGVADLAPLLLSSPLITVDGGGRIDLAAETVDLHLQPQGRAGGVAFSVPMTVRGGLRDPHVAVSDANAAATGLRAALALLAGKGKGEKAPAGPSCAKALAAARG
ncbi:MAG TPA: AsmA family protein [Acetobacteraceae bacterium]